MWSVFLTWHLVFPAVIGFTLGRWNRGCAFPGTLIALALALVAVFTTDAAWWVALVRGLIAAGVFGLGWQMGYQVFTSKVIGESRRSLVVNIVLSIPMAALAMLAGLFYSLVFFLGAAVAFLTRHLRRPSP